jgi:hypothetical protein
MTVSGNYEPIFLRAKSRDVAHSVERRTRADHSLADTEQTLTGIRGGCKTGVKIAAVRFVLKRLLRVDLTFV